MLRDDPNRKRLRDKQIPCIDYVGNLSGDHALTHEERLNRFYDAYTLQSKIGTWNRDEFELLPVPFESTGYSQNPVTLSDDLDLPGRILHNLSNVQTNEDQEVDESGRRQGTSSFTDGTHQINSCGPKATVSERRRKQKEDHR